MQQIRNVLDLMRRGGEGLRFEVRLIMLLINRLNKLDGSPFSMYNLFVVEIRAEILGQNDERGRKGVGAVPFGFY